MTKAGRKEGGTSLSQGLSPAAPIFPWEMGAVWLYSGRGGSMVLHTYHSSSRELRLEDIHFKAGLGYILRPHFKDRGSCDCLVFGGQM